MMLYILLGVAVLAFVGGLIVVIRTGVLSSDDDKAVPISDLTEIRSLRPDISRPGQNPVTPKASPVAAPLAQHLIKENLTAKTSPVISEPKVSEASVLLSIEQEKEIATLHKEIYDLKDQLQRKAGDVHVEVQKITKERDELNAALMRELSAKETKTLQQEERERLAAAEEQIKDLQRMIDHLNTQNRELAKQAEEKKMSVIGLDEQLKLLQSKLDGSENEYKHLREDIERSEQLVQTLREELQVKTRSLLEKNNNDKTILLQLEEKDRIIKSLEDKLNTLSNSREIQLSQNEYTFEQLQQEKEQILFQLKVNELKLQETQKSFEFIKGAYENKMKEATQVIPSLKPVVQPVAMTDDKALKQLEWALGEIEALKKDQEKLEQSNSELEFRAEKLREHNNQLVKKEGMLHYELSKSRAQAVGLEKICTSLKEQMDSLAKTTVH
jgi:chromosome segregation ATPase